MIHENSLNTYIEISEDSSKDTRKDLVYNYIYRVKVCTARDIMKGLGYTDLNMVRPRITELKNEGLIYECGKVKDFITNKMVSLFTVQKINENED